MNFVFKSAISKLLFPYDICGAKDEFLTAIRNDVTKINYYTYMTLAGAKGVTDPFAKKELGEPVFFHYISLWAWEAMKEDV